MDLLKPLPLFQVGAIANPAVVKGVEHIIFMSQVLFEDKCLNVPGLDFSTAANEYVP